MSAGGCTGKYSVTWQDRGTARGRSLGDRNWQPLNLALWNNPCIAFEQHHALWFIARCFKFGDTQCPHLFPFSSWHFFLPSLPFFLTLSTIILVFLGSMVRFQDRASDQKPRKGSRLCHAEISDLIFLLRTGSDSEWEGTISCQRCNGRCNRVFNQI